MGEPKRVRYRLDPVRAKEDLDEVKENYQALGWRYVCHIDSNFRLFAAEDPAAPELYNDSDSMAYAMKSAVRSAAFSLVPPLFYLSVLIHYLSESDTYTWRSLLLQLYESYPFFFAIPILLVFGLLSELYAFSSLFRIRRALQRGQPLRRRSRHFLSVRPLFDLVALVCAVLFLVNLGVGSYYKGQRGYSDPSTLTFPIVSLADLENHPEFELEAFQDNYAYSFHPVEGSYVYSLPSFRAPICLNICQSGLIKFLWWDELVEGYRHNRYEPSLYIQLWETRGTAWAKTIYRNLSQSDQISNWEAALQPLSLDWADQAVIAVSQDNAFQQIILRRGNRVASIQYNGIHSLEEQLPAIQAMMHSPWTSPAK